MSLPSNVTPPDESAFYIPGYERWKFTFCEARACHLVAYPPSEFQSPGDMCAVKLTTDQNVPPQLHVVFSMAALLQECHVIQAAYDEDLADSQIAQLRTAYRALQRVHEADRQAFDTLYQVIGGLLIMLFVAGCVVAYLAA